MNIELSPEQQEAVIVSVLSRDYTNIVTGYYSDDCMKYKEAFETLFQFYLTDAQRKALTPKIYVNVRYEDGEVESVLNSGLDANGEDVGQSFEYGSVEEALDRVQLMKRIYPMHDYYVTQEY